MKFHLFVAMLICLLALPLMTFGDEEDPLSKWVVKLSVQPEQLVFEDASKDKPIELASAKTAEKYFKGEQLKALNKQVDWDAKKVLVFAWRGSGQDKFAFTDIALVNVPEQNRTAVFEYTPGLTRDLRPHVYVYALKKELAWQVVKKTR